MNGCSTRGKSQQYQGNVITRSSFKIQGANCVKISAVVKPKDMIIREINFYLHGVIFEYHHRVGDCRDCAHELRLFIGKKRNRQEINVNHVDCYCENVCYTIKLNKYNTRKKSGRFVFPAMI